MRGSTRHFTLMMSATAALASCVVGPDYRLPDTALYRDARARGEFVEAHNPAVSAAALPQHWWRLFEEPKLDELVNEALTENTDLRIANANLERSEMFLRQVRALREPQVRIDGGVEYAQLAGEQYLLSVTLPRNTYYDTDFTVGYDLDLFGAIRRGIEAARAEDAAVQAARDRVRVNVAAETARAYADVCSAGLQLTAARRSLALQQDSLGLTRQLVRGGRSIDLDVERSQQLLDQLAAAVPGLQAQQRNALYRLTTLTGRPPRALDRTLEQCNQPPRITQPIPVGDGAGLLRRRPDVRESERTLAAATAEIGVATAQLYPDIGLTVGASSSGALSDAFAAPTNFWGLGSILSWQANQSAARARIGQANATARGALANFDGVVLIALRDIESALNTYTHDLEREAATRAARDDAAAAAREAQSLQTGGRVTALAVLDAQRTLAASEQALAQLEGTISNDQVNVFLALGGGWEYGSTPDSPRAASGSER